MGKCALGAVTRRTSAAVAVALVVALLAPSVSDRAFAAAGDIQLVAGSVGSGPATNVGQLPDGLGIANGSLYVPDREGNAVRAIDLATGYERVVAGNGRFGHGGDGGPAVDARLWEPNDVAADAEGNIYISDKVNSRIRKVDRAGVITTVAGGGTRVGEGIPATEANVTFPSGIDVDAAGILYIAGYLNKVWRVDTDGLLTTFAGVGGSSGFGGDGGPATAATLSGPGAVVADGRGNVLIADGGRVRRVDAAGIITTVAGGGTGYQDEGRATELAVHAEDLAVGPDDNLYLSEGYRVRRLDRQGHIAKVAGNNQNPTQPDGTLSDPGDGGPATSAAIGATGVAVDAAGNKYLGEGFRRLVRRVDTAGIITTIGGNGFTRLGGDGGPAATAQLQNPGGLATDRQGNVLVADMDNHRLRRITPAGVITSRPDGRVPGIADAHWTPRVVALDDSGNMYVGAQSLDGNIVQRVEPSGRVTRLAGTWTTDWGRIGDGGPATGVHIEITDIAVDPAGDNLYIADTGHGRVRKVDRAGIITTVAGGGTSTDDDVPATSAALRPTAVRLDGAGNLFVIDGRSQRSAWWTHREPSRRLPATAPVGSAATADRPSRRSSTSDRPAGSTRERWRWTAAATCSSMTRGVRGCAGSTGPPGSSRPWLATARASRARTPPLGRLPWADLRRPRRSWSPEWP